MENILQKVFKKERNVIIGAIHFPPLIGYPEFPGLDTVRLFENKL